MQIEYALNAVAQGAISLGIKATNGVVLATEKKLPSTLIDESTVRKINDLSGNIGVVYSGMGPDNRVLVKRARRVAQAYYMQYNEEIPVAQLVREVAAVMQEYTRAVLHAAFARITHMFPHDGTSPWKLWPWQADQGSEHTIPERKTFYRT